MLDRPTTFTQAIADAICDRLIRGESLAVICDEQGMPSTGTVRYWRNRNAVFAAQYEAAREAQAEAIFDEILDIADDARNDWIERETRNGSYVALNKEAVARSNVRISARQYVLGRMNPRRFGDKAQLDLTSSDGTMSPSNMTDETKAARLTAIHREAQKRVSEKLKAAAPAEDDGSDLV